MQNSSVAARIEEIILTGEIPVERGDFLDHLLCEKKETFSFQEGTSLDYKAGWPFSYSDEYFYGIIRLICAFHNTSGGLIVFGVDDESRRPSSDKVKANIERLNNVIPTILSRPIECQMRSYEFAGEDRLISCLLVPKRRSIDLPVRPIKTLGHYPEGIIWVRRAHEVMEATVADMATLYSGRTEDQENFASNVIDGFVPPSPLTMKKMVGRLHEVDEVFRWLKEDDEPRKFMWGKGGSGKTTIAYQIAKFLHSYGRSIPIFGGQTFDAVIYVTAKNRALNIETAKVDDFRQTDFDSEEDLYKALLMLGDFASVEEVNQWNFDTLKVKLQYLFNEKSLFIVIDDIDTLYTQGIDIDLDYIYKVLVRAQMPARLLYTQRNKPTQSLKNAIEVPGLRRGSEFEPFIEACAKQFRVPPPDSSAIYDEIAEVSERRPLVVETILALRRLTSTYSEALQTFRERGGDEARNYVFGREWDRLAGDNRARALLAALAFYDDWAALGDLKTILRWDEQDILEAISEVSEMFLIRKDDGDGSRFGLGALTREFVLRSGSGLSQAEKIRLHVKNYKTETFGKPGQVVRLEIECESKVRRGEANAAARMMKTEKLPVSVKEHPAFKALFGWVCVRSTPPSLHAAREAFQYCLDMGARIDPRYLSDWLKSEFYSGVGWDTCEKICSYVRSRDEYDDVTKSEFRLWEGSIPFNRGKQIEHTEPTDALKLFKLALSRHAATLAAMAAVQSPLKVKAEKYVHDTGYRYFDLAVAHNLHDEVFDFWSSLRTNQEHQFLDPLLEPTLKFLNIIATKTPSNRLRSTAGRVSQIQGALEGPLKERFEVPECQSEIVSACRRTIERLRAKA